MSFCAGGLIAFWMVAVVMAREILMHGLVRPLASRYGVVMAAKLPGKLKTFVQGVFVNGTLVAEGRIDKTVGLVFSGDETADVGVDHHTNVTPAYPQRGNEFTGTIDTVTVDVSGELIKDTEAEMRQIMARQ